MASSLYLSRHIFSSIMEVGGLFTSFPQNIIRKTKLLGITQLLFY